MFLVLHASCNTGPQIHLIKMHVKKENECIPDAFALYAFTHLSIYRNLKNCDKFINKIKSGPPRS